MRTISSMVYLSTTGSKIPCFSDLLPSFDLMMLISCENFDSSTFVYLTSIG